ncbi:HD domain-containing protein [Candidatus Orientia mediorientalis]|nr:HD domain-containing protein [Candidatus Orientia mediorientalis]
MQKTIDFAVKNCIYHALYPLEIGQIIVAIYPNYSLVIASMLCTTINISDPKITKSDLTKIKNNFGLDIVKLVKNYLKISFNNYLQNDLNQTRTILLEIDKDLKIEVLLVRLAYLLHYISLFNRIQITKEQSQYIIVEILEVYLPLITELGINDIQTKVHKFFLKNLLFSASERDIIDYLNTIKDAELVIYNIADKIRDNLQHAEIKAVISARIKSFCSIQQKMENKSIRLDQLNDIIALRVIIDSTHDALARCYTVLKLLHNDYEFLPEKVQDFIKVPKQNGYQSLHTIIIGPTKQKIEVQIRTSKMHEVAQSGLLHIGGIKVILLRKKVHVIQ